MPHLTHLAHAILIAAYVATALVFVAEGTLSHAGCALAVAAVYTLLFVLA